MNRNLTDSELSQVCDVIAARMGLHFPVDMRAILSRNLAQAARELGFQNMNGFIKWLLSSELNTDQINILASHLTVSETYFMREPHVFNALTDFVLPELIRSKSKEQVEELATKSRLSGRKRSIRIWSAGCSTGEEPYSIAIALHKSVPEIKDWDISILATDINPKSLEKAATGIYGPWSFRNTPDWLKTRYFHDLGDRRFEIIPAIKKMVTFDSCNLTDDKYFSAFADKMDIIFCRNVLMYFTSDWVKRISQYLFQSLSENGWFMVSSSELSSNVFHLFTPVNFPGAVLYRKGKNGYANSLTTSIFSAPVEFDFTTSPHKPISQSPHHPITPSPILPSTNPLQQSPTITEETSSDKIFSIHLLASQGYLSEALSLCNKAIASEKLSPGYYFLRASILQEMDKSSEAIASLKQGIYIDPDHVMGHFILGNLFVRQGNSKNAKRYFKNALGLLKGRKDGDILPESDGLSVSNIREIIFANMQKQE